MTALPPELFTWQPLTLIVSSGLSLFYTVAVQCFNAGWHECSWIALAPSISIRVLILAQAWSIVFETPYFLPDDSPTLDWIAQFPISSFVSILFTIVNMVFMLRTRLYLVQGPRPRVGREELKGRVMMITGANSGIGKETATQLAVGGATVIMACRDETRGKDAVEDVKRACIDRHKDYVMQTSIREFRVYGQTVTINENSFEDGKKDIQGRVHFLKMDVSDLSSVRNAVKSFEKMKLPLHVLINNAGIMMAERKVSVDGNELTLASNHLGHFLLTNLLLPTLKKEEDSRVLAITSSTYALASKGIDLDDLQCNKRSFTMFSQYAQSKLANIMMVKELARRETGIKAYSVHPGLVRTDVVRNMPAFMRIGNEMFGFLLKTLQKSTDAGAYTSVYCATKKEIDANSGSYFVNSEVQSTTRASNDSEAATKLWELSEKIVGLKK